MDWLRLPPKAFSLMRAPVLGDFARSKRGNVAIIFSLTLLPMIGMIGLGVDISRTYMAKSSLQAAADAAALAAVTEAESTLQSSNAFLNSTSEAQIAGQYAGTQMFAANGARVGQWIGGTPTPTVTVTPGTSSITATVSYTANVPTIFGKMFKVNQFAINGTASSALALPKYMNISVLIDNSQSMGLAATSAAQSQLTSITGNCAFGCHVYQQGQNGSEDYEDVAHDNNISLRIDVIKGGTQNMIAAASSLSSGKPLISFSLYTFDASLTTVDSGSSKSGSTNYTQLSSEVGALDLDTSSTSIGPGDTEMVSAMQALTKLVPTPGDGSTAAKAQQFVFLMSDGVEDIDQSKQSKCPSTTVVYYATHCMGPFDSSQCTALKNAGVTVGVIYTTYLQMPGDPRWDPTVGPYTDQIAPAMQACASPGWYYQATQASDLQSAIAALFNKAVNSGVLTQ